MRLIPVLTALLVTGFLYLLIVERDALMDFAQGNGFDFEAVADGPQDHSEGSETPAAASAAVDQADMPARLVRVVAQKSVAREIDSAVILRGETAAARQVDVLAETTGRVISEPLRKGAFVSHGQLLCELDPGTRAISLAEARARLAEARARIPETRARIPEAEARLAQAQAQLDEARLNDNAARKLSQGGFASETRVAGAAAAVRSAEAAVKAAEAGLTAARSGMEGVKAAIQSAEAGVASARREIDRLTITAPFAGLLESDTAELGSLLNSQGGNAHCATIIQLDPIKITGFVPETEVDRVETGARAGARLTTGAREVLGRVTFLSRSADPTTRTFRVEIEVPNPDLAIRDGQTAEIVIASEGEEAHLLPQSALTLDDAGTLGVRLVGPGDIVRFAPVTLLRDTVQGVWVTGLDPEVSVIVVGQEYVVDGVRVDPTYREVTQ